MATGFETMQSAYTALLHPAVNNDDRYDPTFLGVKRKRRLAEPKTVEMVNRGGGKHIDRSKMHHDTDSFAQHQENYVPETFKGATKSTRFGAGFSRRPAKAIGVDTLREANNERQEHRMQTLLDHRRAQNAAKAQQGGGLAHLFGGGGASTAPVPRRTEARAAAVRNKQSSVFAPPDTVQSTRAIARQQRLVHEGLTTTKKDWSVRQQFQTLDGFSLPAV